MDKCGVLWISRVFREYVRLLWISGTRCGYVPTSDGREVLSVSLLNQMHYGRDVQVLGTCLVGIVAAAAAASVAAVAVGRAGTEEDSG